MLCLFDRASQISKVFDGLEIPGTKTGVKPRKGNQRNNVADLFKSVLHIQFSNKCFKCSTSLTSKNKNITMLETQLLFELVFILCFTEQYSGKIKQTFALL